MTPGLRAATARSDQRISELQSADELLISTPMYNFGIPAALKAWIDQVVRGSIDGQGQTLALLIVRRHAGRRR